MNKSVVELHGLEGWTAEFEYPNELEYRCDINTICACYTPLGWVFSLYDTNTGERICDEKVVHDTEFGNIAIILEDIAIGALHPDDEWFDPCWVKSHQLTEV
jgi:hypothetical protein